MIERIDALLKGWKPTFGNEFHLRAMKLAAKMRKEGEKASERDFAQLVWLIKQK